MSIVDNVVKTDRSRTETAQRCARQRWYEYHEAGIGITSVKKPLPLAVGGAVHAGLADLLTQAMHQPHGTTMIHDTTVYEFNENAAVAAALADFAAFDAGRLELDLSEVNAVDDSVFEPAERERVRSAMDQYLYDEQSALVEAMVRAYARRRLRPLLEQYEVLEVEREGEWRLAVARGNGWCRTSPELWFMSRPDALLRERATNDLYIQSFKTGASWDVRKGRDAEHDAQGLSEGVEIEKRLAAWWHRLHDEHETLPEAEVSKPMFHFLRGLSSPPRILGIRYEFLWKGERRKDKDLTARLGVDMRSQQSPLVRGYLNAGMAAGDEQWNWSWDYLKEGGETSKLYWKAWRGAPVWEHMPIAKWIDMLDATVETVAEEGRAAGWSGPAQSTGFTATHPLDDVFHPPIIVFCNDDDLRDWIESTEAQEVRIAEAVTKVQATSDEGEKRSLLNVYFPMSRHSCEYPSTCQFTKLCYGGEHMRAGPLSSGLYKLREPNHPQEIVSEKTKK